jgi:hypothetical protein
MNTMYKITFLIIGFGIMQAAHAADNKQNAKIQGAQKKTQAGAPSALAGKASPKSSRLNPCGKCDYCRYNAAHFCYQLRQKNS